MHGNERNTHKLIVLDVQEHQLRPQVALLGSTNDFRDVDASHEELQVLHDYETCQHAALPSHKEPLTLCRAVLAEQDRQLREDTHVRAFETETSLKQADDLVEVPSPLVHLDERAELLSVHNDVETTNLRQTELALLNTRGVHLLPDPCMRISIC